VTTREPKKASPQGEEYGTDQYLHRFDVLLGRFFDLSLDLLCIAGMDGHFKTLNPAWPTVLGYSEEELLSRPWLDFVHPDDREVTNHQSERVKAGETVLTFENRYIAADGSYHWLGWTAIPSVEESLVYCVARDVSEQKQRQQLERSMTGVVRAVAGSTDWDAGVQGSLRAIGEQLGWAAGRMWELDGDSLKPTVSWSAPGQDAHPFSPEVTAADEAVAGLAWARGAPVEVSDLCRPDDQLPGVSLQPTGIRGAVAFPVRQGDSVRGVMSFLAPNAKPLVPGLLDVAGAIGLQVGEFAQRLDAEAQGRRAEALMRSDLEFRASHDPLTGLPNRTLALDRLGSAIRGAKRSGRPVAVMMLDLDGFKALNDTYGHQVGDEALKQVAARLLASIRESDTVARIGGDEFAVVALDVDAAAAEVVAAKVVAAFDTDLALGSAITTRPSLGVAIYPRDGDNADALLRRADSAMYAAKTSGTGHALYVEGMPDGRGGSPQTAG
jgi:diguanylate cyclase (GGDEF)-like protein/PAS domain S-box-containing protein